MTEQAHPAANLGVLFTTSTVHARDRLAFWREEASKAYVQHAFSTSVGRGFQGEIRAGSIGTMEIAQFTCDECVVRRTSDCLQGANDDDLLISLPFKDGLILHQDGRDAVVQSNALFLLDPRRPFSMEFRFGSETLVLKVPRAELQSRLGDLSALTAQPLSSRRPECALASSFLTMVMERATALEEPAGGKVAQQLLDLIALAFEAEMPVRRATLSSSRATTLLRLKAVIEARLHEADLRPSIAAAAAGISVRYANALLAQEDMSLERFILHRRLQRCRRALEDPAYVLRPVSAIAYEHGFSDVSHFTRRFRSQFGCSPREYRSRALG